MDFITNAIQVPSQPAALSSELNNAPASPSTLESADQSTLATTETSKKVAGVGPDDTTDTASFDTSTTQDRERDESAGAAFNQLRTVQKRGETVSLPSQKSGDWRAYSRVQAKVVVWNQRDLVGNDVELRKLREEEGIDQEWSLTGNLWITKNNALVFILDSSSPPELVPISSTFLIKRPLTHRLSLSLSRSISNPSRKTDSTDEKEEKSRGAGLVGFVKKILRGDKLDDKDKDKDKSVVEETPANKTVEEDGSIAPKDSPPLALNVEKTITTNDSDPAAVPTNGTTTAPKSPGTGKSLTWRRGSEVGQGRGKSAERGEGGRILESPLPTCQGQSVVALTIIDLATSVQNIRYTAHSAGSPPLSRTTSNTPSTGGAPAPQKVALTSPARVEFDVGRKERGSNSDGDLDHGQKRDVTVAFCFGEIMLAHEAEDFRDKLQSLAKKA